MEQISALSILTLLDCNDSQKETFCSGIINAIKTGEVKEIEVLAMLRNIEALSLKIVQAIQFEFPLNDTTAQPLHK